MQNEGSGLLPVKGALPDMTADSEKYIALQQMWVNYHYTKKKKKLVKQLNINLL